MCTGERSHRCAPACAGTATWKSCWPASRSERGRRSYERATPPLGVVGEGLAVAHLEANGYRVAARKVRLPEGEIDIVARTGVITVLVEVGAGRGPAMGDGLESIDGRKAARLRTLAASYAAREGLSGDVRIDVIAVDMDPDGRLRGLRHVQNAVEGEGD
ncbi:MAG: YraN family protein [Dehalococcoidia bacterium]|nr:YraN family protein [Dehalococcoidia bacterium]